MSLIKATDFMYEHVDETFKSLNTTMTKLHDFSKQQYPNVNFFQIEESTSL